MTAMTALLGFAAWTLALVVLQVGVFRSIAILSGKPINGWARGAATNVDPAMSKRLGDAHANALENLPIFAVIVLAAYALGKSPAIAALAPWVLYARFGQSIVHAIGTSQPLVLVRATFWIIQVGLFIAMFVKLL